MKKIVPSRNKLNEMALSSGAAVTDKKGKVFNVGKDQVESKPRPKPKTVPVEKGPDEGAKLLADKLDEIGRANVIMLNELKGQIAQINLSLPSQPDRWIIDWIRDDNGFTTQTVLTPVYKERVLN